MDEEAVVNGFSSHRIFVSLKARETKVCLGGNKVMDFYEKLNVVNTEGRQTCVGTTFAVLSWETEEEKYDVEEFGYGVFVVYDK